MSINIKQSLTEFVQYMGTFKFWKELVIMTLGMAVTAAAVYYFLVPSPVSPSCWSTSSPAWALR